MMVLIFGQLMSCGNLRELSEISIAHGINPNTSVSAVSPSTGRSG